MSEEENDASETVSGGSSSPVQPEEEPGSVAAAELCDAPHDLDCQPSVTKMLKTWTFGRHKKGAKVNGKKRKGSWTLKFGGQTHCSSNSDVAESSVGCSACICTRYRRTEEHHLGAGLVFNASSNAASSKSEIEETENSETASYNPKLSETLPSIDFSKFNPEIFPVHAWSDRSHQDLARQTEGGADPPVSFQRSTNKSTNSQFQLWDLTFFLQNGLSLDMMANPFLSRPEEVTGIAQCTFANPCLYKSASDNISYLPTAHTRVDYEHCLVPDFLEITNSSFYWGKMDRYEADKLLENKPEGTFLLRDSAQEEYLFSVSFRRYGRTLHARVEQREHRFSFDSHDPNVFSSSTVCGLIEHYKYPSNCMFFEPKLTIRLHRVFPFSLQHLCRAVVCSRLEYNNINKLQLPKILKSYLKEYHYKHKVRAENLDKEA